MQEAKRDKLVDILKGIGIISVVIGHSGVLSPVLEKAPVTAFVYLYHLMIFFFAAGMVFHPEKYRDPYIYIGRQLKSSFPLYIGYNFAFLLLHNLFSKLQLLDITALSAGEFVVNSTSIALFNHTELLTGTLWFVPMFLLAKSFFAIAYQTADRFRCRLLLHTAVVMASGYLALRLNYQSFYLQYHLQTALLGIPVIYAGYVFSQHREKLIKLANPVICVISAAGMVWILKNVGFIELSQNRIISPVWFYPATMLGVLFCISLGKMIMRWERCSNIISYIGSVSFHIMALHFFVFKAFDWIYGYLTGASPEIITRFPQSYDNTGWLYTLLGIGLPTLAVYLIRKFKARRKITTAP